MKKLTHLSFIFLALITFYNGSAQLKPGTMVEGSFASDNKKYVAEITASTETTFTCRFVHSGTVYTLTHIDPIGDQTMNAGRQSAKVVSSRGGKFGPDEIFNYHAFKPVDKPCDPGTGTSHWENYVVATFPDGRRFLGHAESMGEECKVTFSHSGAIYRFDKSGVVKASGGSYSKGTRAVLRCAPKVY